MAYAVKRLTLLAPLLLLISALTFALTDILPGDVAEGLILRGGGQPTEEAVASVRSEMGLDRPLWQRYFSWLDGLAHLDLGSSWRTQEPVLEVLLSAARPTLLLTGSALVFGMVLALALGILSALYRNRLLDRVALGFTLINKVVPDYLLAFALMFLFALTWQVLPLQGYGSWQQAILPAATLGLGLSAHQARILRSSLLEVLGQSYITLAQAKGLSRPTVVTRHALKNALLPVVTTLGDGIGFLLGGAVIIENIFNWPGLGRLALEAIGSRDLPVLQAYALMMAIIIVVVNLAVDLSYRWLDPRISLGGQRHA